MLNKLMYFVNTYNIKVIVGICGWMVIKWFGGSVGGRVGCVKGVLREPGGGGGGVVAGESG